MKITNRSFDVEKKRYAVREGNLPKNKTHDIVQVHYHGFLEVVDKLSFRIATVRQPMIAFVKLDPRLKYFRS